MEAERPPYLFRLLLDPCPCCLRPLPRTALHLWLEQRQRTIRDLAAEISEHPIVQRQAAESPSRRQRGPRKSQAATTNLVWRLNHQSPQWRGAREGSISWAAQVALLEITGLEVSDLQNELPTGGFSFTAIRRRATR